MKLSLEERETVIVFNEKDKDATVFTYNTKFLNQLNKLAQERPAECVIVKQNSDGAVEYKVPKSWIRLRAKRIVSPEQHKILSERAKQNIKYLNSK